MSVEFNKYPAQMPNDQDGFLTIAAGPVIIEEIDGKMCVLVDKHGEDPKWKFPGGKLIDTNSPMDNAKREVGEELGIEIEVKNEPYVFQFLLEKDSKKVIIILIHYYAQRLNSTIQIGRDVREFAWLPIDELVEKECMPNIIPAVNHFRKVLNI